MEGGRDERSSLALTCVVVPPASHGVRVQLCPTLQNVWQPRCLTASVFLAVLDRIVHSRAHRPGTFHVENVGPDGTVGKQPAATVRVAGCIAFVILFLL